VTQVTLAYDVDRTDHPLKIVGGQMRVEWDCLACAAMRPDD
jgi:hypothetical protein